LESFRGTCCEDHTFDRVKVQIKLDEGFYDGPNWGMAEFVEGFVVESADEEDMGGGILFVVRIDKVLDYSLHIVPIWMEDVNSFKAGVGMSLFLNVIDV